MALNYKRTFFMGLAFLSICAFWQLYDNIIPLILKNTFGMGETMTGVIMALGNVLALFLLPLFGALSDKVRTPIGKRTPFILVGTGIAVIFMILIPISDRMNHFWFFIIALFVVLIAMGFYRSPAVALMPDLTPKPLRSKANAVINLMGAVGGVIALVAIRFFIIGGDRPNYFYVFLIVAILMVISVVILLFTINENKFSQELYEKYPEEREQGNAESLLEKVALQPDVRKSLYLLLLSIFLWFMAYNAVTTAFSRYAVVVWGLQGGSFANALLVATVAAIISYIPIGFMASKFGRKKLILAGIIMMSMSYFVGAFFLDFSWGINIVFAFTGIGWAAINVNSYPMVVEMSRGSDVGKYTGYYYTFSMAAQITTPILSGFLLEKISYRVLFPYAVLFSILSFFTMILVRHGDSRPEKRSHALEHFDVED